MSFHPQLRDKLVSRQRALVEQYLDVLDEGLDPDLLVGRYRAALLSELPATDAQALHELSSAIERFDAHTYGTCVGCGQEIAERRLQVLPTAELCFECASHAEKN